MKQLSLLLSIIACGIAANAQSYQDFKVFSSQFAFEAGELAYLYGDNVKFREGPNLESNTIAQLPIGTEIEIISKTNETYIYDGIEYPWYKVKYKDKTGYILGGLISLTKLHTSKGKGADFLFKLKASGEDNLYLDIRVKSSDGSFSEKSILLTGYQFALELTDSKGLAGVDHILMVDYISEACGMQGGVSYFFWINGQLKHIANLSEVADAGVFHFSETFTFPNDKDGVKGKLVYQKEHSETEDEALNWHNTTSVYREYDWDGVELSPKFVNKD